MHARTWIFDLDNTLHDARAHVFPHIDRSMTAYLQATGFTAVRPWTLAEYPELAAVGDCASSSWHVTLYLEATKAGLTEKA